MGEQLLVQMPNRLVGIDILSLEQVRGQIAVHVVVAHQLLQDFGITVEATHTTSAKEGGEPYTHSENLGGWTTKGYYINETVADYDGAFYIAGDKFYKASAALTLYPHRVTFHGAWTKSGTSGEAQFYNINTVSDSETITAIEAADLRHTRSVAAEVYDVAGRRLPEMVKGLNIVRMNDGSVRKVSIR